MKTENLTPSERWDRATLADDFIFYFVMRDNPDLCKRLLEILLHIKVEKIEYHQEETISVDVAAKGIRLDLYVSNTNQVFDIELQVRDTRELPERARYYQAAMDVDSLKQGQTYSELKENHVIFICLKDIFEKGFPRYDFKTICLQDKEFELEDRIFKHFFIAENYDKIKNDDELKAFLNLLLTNKANSTYTETLLSGIETAKLTTNSKRSYMEFERLLTYEKREGIALGAEQKAIETAKKLIQMNLSFSQIAEATGLSLEQIEKLQQELLCKA